MSAPPGVEIRSFCPTDLGALHRLIHETIDASYAGVYPPRAIAFFKRFHDEGKILERAQIGTVLVTEQNGDLIATGSLVGDEILAVFVHPACRRAGLGKALTAALEYRAVSAGIRQLTLSVSLTSKRFYQDLGYDVLKICSKDVGEGQKLDFWRASKTLSPEVMP